MKGNERTAWKKLDVGGKQRERWKKRGQSGREVGELVLEGKEQ